MYKRQALRKAGYEQPPAAAYQTVWSAEVCCPKGQNDMAIASLTAATASVYFPAYSNTLAFNALAASLEPDPILGNDDCLVKIEAAALNRADLMQREGDYPPPAGPERLILK